MTSIWDERMAHQKRIVSYVSILCNFELVGWFLEARVWHVVVLKRVPKEWEGKRMRWENGESLAHLKSCQMIVGNVKYENAEKRNMMTLLRARFEMTQLRMKSAVSFMSHFCTIMAHVCHWGFLWRVRLCSLCNRKWECKIVLWCPTHDLVLRWNNRAWKTRFGSCLIFVQFERFLLSLTSSGTLMVNTIEL